ncbi:MAG: 50S ribosomal protein L18 [Methanomassiliicoccaceae archaeon]|nr:50S ribosomal protein L18 [Methanomassiliicoccaceae archaeon]
MATGPRYKVPFRRRRENRTDYYIRKKLLTSGELRAVVRRSSKNVTIQFASFGMDGDAIAVSATSKELKTLGWKHACSNIPAAYLTGHLAGKKAKDAGIEYAVLDIGMQTPSKGAVLFAAVAGMVDAGLEIPHGEGVLPADERISGSHISETFAADVDAVLNAIGGKRTMRPSEKAPAKEPAKAAPAKAEGGKAPAKAAGGKAPAKDAKAKAPAKKKTKEAE